MTGLLPVTEAVLQEQEPVASQIVRLRGANLQQSFDLLQEHRRHPQDVPQRHAGEIQDENHPQRDVLQVPEFKEADAVVGDQRGVVVQWTLLRVAEDEDSVEVLGQLRQREGTAAIRTLKMAEGTPGLVLQVFHVGLDLGGEGVAEQFGGEVPHGVVHVQALFDTLHTAFAASQEGFDEVFRWKGST